MRIMLSIAVTFAVLGCGDGNDLTCDERRDHANNMIEAALSENLSCKVDADCTTVSTDTGCGGSCPSAVASDGVGIVQDAVQQADQDYCKGYTADGCHAVSPGCIVGHVGCSADGKCVLTQR